MKLLFLVFGILSVNVQAQYTILKRDQVQKDFLKLKIKSSTTLHRLTEKTSETIDWLSFKMSDFDNFMLDKTSFITCNPINIKHEKKRLREFYYDYSGVGHSLSTSIYKGKESTEEILENLWQRAKELERENDFYHNKTISDEYELIEEDANKLLSELSDNFDKAITLSRQVERLHKRLSERITQLESLCRSDKKLKQYKTKFRNDYLLKQKALAEFIQKGSAYPYLDTSGLRKVYNPDRSEKDFRSYDPSRAASVESVQD